MSKRKLLLADDSITIQKVVNLTFADEGIEVISVGDGNSAMDKLREDMPDLVMADVNMPGLNGYEICENIKQSGNNGSNTPVILLVGSFEPFDEEEANRVGADDYLTKPFQSISQLVEKVTELLNLGEEENLEDTAEMYVDENEQTINTPVETAEVKNLTDDFNDDEMIQTAQVGSVPIDDVSKYESTPEIPTFEPEERFGEQILDLQEPDFNITQPLTQSDYQELSIEEPAVDESGFSVESKSDPKDYTYGTNDEPTLDIESGFKSESKIKSASHSDVSEVLGGQEDFEPAEIQTSETVEPETSFQESTEDINSDLPMPEAASILELDELNLLDLPPLEGLDDVETSDEDDSNDLNSIGNLEQTVKEPITSKEINEIANEVGDNVSSETVRAIAEKVLERVSEKEVKEIAWEVVPELAELIIKKIAKEKMNN